MSKLIFVRSHVPQLYDVNLPNFIPPKDGRYSGAKIRLHVKVPADKLDYDSWLENKRKVAEATYKNATVLIVPEFEEKSVASNLPDNSTDKQKIQSYVEQTIPGLLQNRTQAIVEFLYRQLSKIKASKSTSTGVEFISVDAENILCFKKVNFKFSPGIRLVLGRNDDWGGGSNGAGKSGLLQLLRVAIFGSTTKNQEHGKLVRRFKENGEPSFVRASFGNIGVSRVRNGNSERHIEAIRSRDPVGLELRINGQDRSSGHTKKKTGYSTQELIEQEVGMTQDMFDHSVIIDQKVLHMADNFLAGTDKDKKQLLDSFLGTERFLAAGELIRKISSNISRELERTENLVKLKTEIAKELKTQIVTIKQDNAKKEGELKTKIQSLKSQIQKLNYSKEEADKLIGKQRTASLVYEKASEEWHNLNLQQMRLSVQRDSKVSQIKNLKSSADKTCVACGQAITQTHVSSCLKTVQEEFTQLQIKLNFLEPKCKAALLAKETAYTEDSRLVDLLIRYRYKKERYQELSNELATTKNTLATPGISLTKTEQRLNIIQQQLAWYRPAITELKHKQEFYTYCESVFSRKGLVNFLYEQCCAPLNKAAKYYSEIFTDGLIQLRFSPKTQRKSGDMANEFCVEIVNSQGGETREDQSRGEEQLCAVMCIFCLREIGPQSNLLILDEPVEGLDPINSRKFAQGLIKLQKKFPCIMLATHNPDLLSQFRGEHSLMVVKKKHVAELREYQIA